MGLTYVIERKVDSYACTFDYTLSPTAVLNFFQESCLEQSAALGVGPDFMDSRKLGWFLVKYDLHFHAYPHFGDAITVETEAVGCKQFAYHRRFALRDAAGKALMEADSEWMIFDRDGGRLVRLEEVPENEAYQAAPEMHFRMKRLTRVEAWTEEKQFQVRYLDIDFNGHVNHVKYLAWALETLPLEKVKTMEVERARIIYKNQAFYGDMVTVRSCLVGPDAYRMDIENSDGLLLCQLEIAMRGKS
jgi:medium-chain acyl-[acyl-carrier-protein] hydrolase